MGEGKNKAELSYEPSGCGTYKKEERSETERRHGPGIKEGSVMISQIISAGIIFVMIIVMFFGIMKILDSVEKAEKEIESRKASK